MRRSILIAIAAAVLLSACGGTAASTTTPISGYTPATLSRPASPVQITLLSPTTGQVVHGGSLHVAVSIMGGTITPVYSTHISPTVGHVHLYLNNELIYMSYTLQQDLPVNAGATYSMYAEWVASDHFPFSPRVETPKVYFSVAPS